MKTAIKILLVFWTLMGAFGLISAIYFFITGYNKDGLFFLAIAAASAVMYWMNTKRMKLYVTRLEEQQRAQQETKK